jgi:hypothetical protein
MPFEHRKEKVISRWLFAQRMTRAAGLWLGFMLGGLLLGMAGYGFFEGMGPADAFVNAAMILSGMGPVTELHTVAGKIFAGSYAIFSGLVLVIGAGFILAPVFHRVLHLFHVERAKDD